MDFADAAQVFAGKTFDIPDERKDYGELRVVTVGMLYARMVMMPR